MSKFTKIFLSIFLCLVLLSGCGVKDFSKNNSDKISIVTTIFPLYDFTRNIVRDSDNVEVVYLLNNGIDLHNYSPSIKDISEIKDSDIFIYVGGESDEWVEEIIEDSDTKAINLMEYLKDSALYEEEKEGMTSEDEEEMEEEEEEFDEHFWTSIPLAMKSVEKISSEIISLDSKNKSIYEKNTKEYLGSLSSLKTEYDNYLNSKKGSLVIFGDRFPFLYLFKEYDIDYFAAFKGCSAASEASFETISFLTDKFNDSNLDSLIIVEGNSSEIAKTIIDNSNKKDSKILELNAMQNVNSKDDSVSYISFMNRNLEVLKEVLK